MKFATLLPLFAIFTSACVSGTINETVSVDNNVAFTGAPVPIGVVSTSDQTVPVDITDAVSKLNKYGTPTITIEQSTLTGNISFITHIKVAVENTDMPQTLVLCDVDISSTSNTTNLPLNANSATLLNYLSGGSADLHFWITGSIPQGNVDIESNILLGVSDSVSKGL